MTGSRRGEDIGGIEGESVTVQVRRASLCLSNGAVTSGCVRGQLHAIPHVQERRQSLKEDIIDNRICTEISLTGFKVTILYFIRKTVKMYLDIIFYVYF